MMRFFFLPFRQRSRNDVARGRILSLHPTSRGEMYTEAVCVGLERASNSLHCGSICKADECLCVCVYMCLCLCVCVTVCVHHKKGRTRKCKPSMCVRHLPSGSLFSVFLTLCLLFPASLFPQSLRRLCGCRVASPHHRGHLRGNPRESIFSLGEQNACTHGPQCTHFPDSAGTSQF